MSILAGRKAEAAEGPAICFVCARSAKGLGVCVGAYKNTIGWLCDDTACLKAGKRVYGMNMRELDRFEQIAIHDAIRAIGPKVFEGMLDILFDSGVRSLEEISEEKIGLLTADLSANLQLKRCFEDFLKRYSDELRKQITGTG